MVSAFPIGSGDRKHRAPNGRKIAKQHGNLVSGFLYRPPVKFSGKRPVLVVIHGGPEGQSLPNFLGRQNYLLNELGIALIYPNVRGSTGYGKTFTLLDNGFQREDTYKDINALFDWIATQPELDASRVGVTGGELRWSYDSRDFHVLQR
jgi:dipeptidyl aminopeptidase/acylaminoacyl peptidase